MENNIENTSEDNTSYQENLSIDNGLNNLSIRAEGTFKLFSSEEFRKIQSDSTSMVSDSSEGNECLTDSETKSLKNFSQRSKRNFSKGFDTEYSDLKNQRSKSQMFKKRRYIENAVVNEERAEDENEIEKIVRRKPMKFSNISMDDDLPSKFSRKIFKQESFNTSNITTPSHSITINMDPVVEVKEDERETNQGNIMKTSSLLNSPRIIYLTDIKEDLTFSSVTYHTPSCFYIPKDYSLETDEIITEDNNENIVESDFLNFKRDSLHKHRLDTMIDKEESLNLHELNVNCNITDFEIIKEENIEEDDKFVMSYTNRNRESSKSNLICKNIN